MESTCLSNVIEPTRQELLRIWLGRKKTGFKQLGQKMGISGQAVSELCDGDTIPTRRHAQLVELGVPSELLPFPQDINPGPKPRDMGYA